jgi:hypothetical protein
MLGFLLIAHDSGEIREPHLSQLNPTSATRDCVMDDRDLRFVYIHPFSYRTYGGRSRGVLLIGTRWAQLCRSNPCRDSKLSLGLSRSGKGWRYYAALLTPNHTRSHT